ncbi:hypothetical protein GCM10022600_02840 [Qipengyuania pelagi]
MLGAKIQAVSCKTYKFDALDPKDADPCQRNQVPVFFEARFRDSTFNPEIGQCDILEWCIRRAQTDENASSFRRESQDRGRTVAPDRRIRNEGNGAENVGAIRT